MTPTMVYASSLSFTVRPITSGCPPNSVLQNRSLRTTTYLPPGVSSSCRMTRPSASDDLEKARADSCRTYCSRGARVGERELPEATALVHRHPLERLCIPLPVVELAGGELEESTTGRPGEDPHQAFRLLERQGTQQDRVDDAEDRRVGADAKRQHADDGNGERWCPGDDPERITKIGKHRTHPRARDDVSVSRW